MIRCCRKFNFLTFVIKFFFLTSKKIDYSFKVNKIFKTIFNLFFSNYIDILLKRVCSSIYNLQLMVEFNLTGIKTLI